METTFLPAFPPAVLLAYKASPHPKIQPKQCCWGEGRSVPRACCNTEEEAGQR